MLIPLIIFGVFIVLVIMMRVFWSKSTLEELQLWNGERILFEESPVETETVMPPRGNTLFINCFIRLTNYRIIVAQKVLLSGKYTLRYVIHITDAPGFPVGGASTMPPVLKTGYVTFRITRNEISAQSESDKPFIRILPGASGPLLSGIPKALKITLNRYSDFMDALNRLT